MGLVSRFGFLGMKSWLTMIIKVKPARHTASLSVEFLIIGAGIAGLASAIALRRVGHRVSVLEKHDSITKVRRSHAPSNTGHGC